MITNKHLFKHSNFLKVKIHNSFEALLHSEYKKTFHYTRYGANTEGIMLIWNGDVFNMGETIYVRELK